MLIIFIVVIILLAVGPFFIKVPKLDGLVDAKTLVDADSKFIKVNGVDVHYKEAGSGEITYILLHGFGASTFSWREVMPELAKSGRVIAFDRPGFGLTERLIKLGKNNPYDSKAQVALSIGLMDALGIKKAVVIGHSAGGVVALNMALNYPDRVSNLVLVDAIVYESGVLYKWLLPLVNTPQMNHLGPLFARVAKIGGDEFLRSTWHDQTKITPAIYNGYHKVLKIKDWDKALWNLTRSTYSLHPEKHLSELSMPVLVITGDDDRVVFTKNSIKLASEIPGSKLEVIQNSGHIPHEEQPVEFMRVLGEWLK